MDEVVLALDFGGTKLTAALAESIPALAGRQKWLDHQRVLSPEGADARTDLTTMMKLGRDLARGRRLVAVGTSFGGPVNHQTGIVRLSHHVPGWEGVPLKARLESAFGVPVQVDNDANVAALGEFWLGAGRDHRSRSMLYITVSTGIGGGWILDGQPWRGHEGMAGEIGHMVVDATGPECLCGKRGCVERLASGPYLAADARQILAESPERGRRLREVIAAGDGRVTGERLAEAAALGDEVASDLLSRSATALGLGIGNAANLINPGLFVLGGGVTKSGPRWWDTVRKTAVATALPEVHFDVLPAALGDDAPLWGAVALVQAKLKRRP